MKKTLMIAALAGLVGFGAGNAFWYLASPLWIDVTVSESASAAETASVIGSATFAGADAIHQGSGTATVFEGTDGKRIVRFTDFEVTNGPDLKVWLVANPDVTEADDVNNAEYVSLGVLKGNIGDQNYDIPEGVDLEKFQSVVIWCEQFSVLFASASLAN